MRIPSGSTDKKLAFVAVDATDLKTRETGLSGFTVYRSRNGGAATAYTTPTVAELSAANMPGVYVLTLDEDTTIDAGSDEQEYVVHITHASMHPVTRAVELYRVKLTEGNTLDVTAAGEAGIDLDNASGALGTAQFDAAFLTAALIAAGAITSAKFAAGAIDAAAIATDAIDADALKADAITEIQAGLATAAAQATLQADTDDIQARLPAALVGGRIDANMGAISADATAADNLETMLDGTGGQTLSLKQLNVVNSTGSAIIATAGGSGHGIIATGSGVGSGFAGVGGNTGGAGFVGLGGTDGSGFHGIGTGTGDGFEAAAGASGVDIRGNITGNLSGSVGSVTLVSASAITSASFAAGAINAAATGADFVTEIWAGSGDVGTWATRGLTMIELDGAVYRYTANALEQGPSGSGGDATAANQTLILQGLTDLKHITPLK